MTVEKTIHPPIDTKCFNFLNTYQQINSHLFHFGKEAFSLLASSLNQQHRNNEAMCKALQCTSLCNSPTMTKGIAYLITTIAIAIGIIATAITVPSICSFLALRLPANYLVDKFIDFGQNDSFPHVKTKMD